MEIAELADDPFLTSPDGHPHYAAVTFSHEDRGVA
jgi:hypothetical protein